MPVCKLCSSAFPNRVWVNEKWRVLNRRRYCLSCSPFGEHNTRALRQAALQCGLEQRAEKYCPTCGCRSFSRRANTCSACYAKKRRVRIKAKIHALVGNQCWVCGYGDEVRRAVLDFHHISRETKAFNLSAAATTTHSWREVRAELEKCALLCCRCHREVEAGILESAVVKRVYHEHWQQIRRA